MTGFIPQQSRIFFRFLRVALFSFFVLLCATRGSAQANLQEIYSFSHSVKSPFTLNLAKNGSLYGVTASGGTYDRGALFRVNPSGTLTRITDLLPGMEMSVTPPVQGTDGVLY